MWKILCAGSAERQLKLRNPSSSIVLPCAEEEAGIWKLSRRREDSGQELIKIGYYHNGETCFSQMSPGLD
nr:unnamed protein product [Callosobruchus chinensis]